MCIWIFIYLFFNLLARNPLVWWIHVCGNLDIVNFFFLYTSFAASLRWCAFTIKHSEIIWFSRRYFHVFFKYLRILVNLCVFVVLYFGCSSSRINPGDDIYKRKYNMQLMCHCEITQRANWRIWNFYVILV